MFAALAVAWGLPYMLIKIAVGSLSPAVVVCGRLSIATLILLPIAWSRGGFSSLRGHWRWVIAFALVEMSVTWLALTYAEQHVTSSLAAIMVATVPLVTSLLAMGLGLDDRLTPTRWAGLAAGFVGIAAVVGLDVRSSGWLALGALVVTVIGYSIGPIIIDRRLSQIPSLPVVTAAVTINAILYLPFAWLTRPTAPVPTAAWASVVTLGVVSTALAFMLFFALVAEVGPARSTLVTYLNTLVAVLLGVALLGEPVTWGLIIGTPLVLLGSWFATRTGPAIETEPHA